MDRLPKNALKSVLESELESEPDKKKLPDLGMLNYNNKTKGKKVKKVSKKG